VSAYESLRRVGLNLSHRAGIWDQPGMTRAKSFKFGDDCDRVRGGVIIAKSAASPGQVAEIAKNSKMKPKTVRHGEHRGPRSQAQGAGFGKWEANWEPRNLGMAIQGQSGSTPSLFIPPIPESKGLRPGRPTYFPVAPRFMECLALGWLD
jgi:hypothetical protein